MALKNDLEMLMHKVILSAFPIFLPALSHFINKSSFFNYGK